MSLRQKIHTTAQRGSFSILPEIQYHFLLHKPVYGSNYSNTKTRKHSRQKLYTTDASEAEAEVYCRV